MLPDNEIGWLVGKGTLRKSPENGHYIPTQAPAWSFVPRADRFWFWCIPSSLDVCGGVTRLSFSIAPN